MYGVVALLKGLWIIIPDSRKGHFWDFKLKRQVPPMPTPAVQLDLHADVTLESDFCCMPDCRCFDVRNTLHM